jgi:hypothetical protein
VVAADVVADQLDCIHIFRSPEPCSFSKLWRTHARPGPFRRTKARARTAAPGESRRKKGMATPARGSGSDWRR